MPDRFRLVYDREVFQHLRAIDRKFHAQIRTSVEEQLQWEPDVETASRKPLRQQERLDATWELRCGRRNEFRVFYRVEPSLREVYIRAIGVKMGNRLTIGEETFEL